MAVGRAMACCAQRGHVSTMMVFLRHMSAHRSTHETHYAALVRPSMMEAARSGHIGVLRVLFDDNYRATETVYNWKLFDLGSVLAHATQMARTDVVDWVADELDDIKMPDGGSDILALLLNNLRLAVVDTYAILMASSSKIADRVRRWSLLECRLVMALLAVRRRTDVVEYITT